MSSGSREIAKSSREKSPEEDQLLRTSPMVYAVVSNPVMIDNPDIKSYQPYVHGRCKPPALIPLHMYGIEVEVDCYLDMAFVSLTGTWRLHCVDGNKKCDCQLAIPMGEQVLKSKLLEVRILTVGTGCEALFCQFCALKDLASELTFPGLLHNLYPSMIQDLSCGCPVIISGRYKGKLPESLMVRGTLADMSNFMTDLKVSKAKDIPLDKVFAKAQVDALTAKAWFMESKEVQKQVAEISMQTGVPSEYTRMILFQTDAWNQGPDAITIQGKEAYDKNSLQKMVRSQKIILLQIMGVGFGNLEKTAENLPPGVIVKAPDTTEFLVNAATGYCGELLDRFCCMCFIQGVSKLSDRCVITFSQICAALACFQCLDCCYDLCDSCC